MVAVRQVIHSQKMKFYINGFFSKCDLILSFLQIWSHLLKEILHSSKLRFLRSDIKAKKISKRDVSEAKK